MISEKGSLSETSPSKLLLSIHDQRLTGILYLKKDETLKVFYFSQGKFTWAMSNAVEDRLETMLIKKNIVSAEVIETQKKLVKIVDHLGKQLVENGLLTLEELVSTTKEQLRQIIASVLTWDSGGFQFVRDTPPERLISLDLDIPDYVHQAIQENPDLTSLWKELGSMQIQLQKNADLEKIQRYSLTADLQEILQEFTESTVLEAFLSRFPNNRKQPLLKSVYFLLIAGLLVKQDREKSLSVEPDITPPSMPSINLDEPELDLAASLGEALGEKPDEDIIEPEKPRFLLQPEKSSRPRILNLVLIFVAMVLVLAGLFFLLLSPSRHPATTGGEEKEFKKEERVQSPSKQAAPPTVTAKVEVPAQEKKSGPQPVRPENARKKPIEKKVDKPVPKNLSGDLSAAARRYLLEGNLVTAADVWRQEALNQRYRFTILLELDCQKESVLHAYRQFTAGDAFFILNRRLSTRNCFLVLWGKFASQEEAAQGLKLIPHYFWNQPEPPEVKEISTYLQ